MSASPPTAQYTRALAEFAAGVRAEQIPDDVRREVARALLDCLGCAVAGLITPAGRIAVDLVKDERGPLQAQVVGAGEASVLPAVFANAILTNALDFDVYGPEGHVAPTVVPSALAMAAAVAGSGEQLLEAVTVGLEVGGRIGGAIRRYGRGGANRGQVLVRGHAHNAIAGAAAAGRLLGLTPDQMHHAFGIAGYAATVPSLNKFQRSPHAPMTKYDHLGAMSRNGVEAALLAQRGFTGDLEVLEGEDGFWRFAGGSDGCDWEHLRRDFGGYWTIREMTHKPYPVNLYNQPHVVAVEKIVREAGLRPDDIEEIEIRSSRTGGSLYTQLRGPIDAYRNQGYMLAAMIHGVRPLRSWHLPETIQRDDLRALAGRVTTKPFRDGEVTSVGNYWERWAPVRVTVRAKGQLFEGGSDELPNLDDAGVSAKFRENVCGLLTESDAQALEQACWNLASVADVRDMACRLRVQAGA